VITAAVCKSVGLAYEGSNPSPATPCESGPLPAETLQGPLSGVFRGSPLYPLVHPLYPPNLARNWHAGLRRLRRSLVLAALLAAPGGSRVPQASRSDVHVWGSGSPRMTALDAIGTAWTMYGRRGATITHFDGRPVV